MSDSEREQRLSWMAENGLVPFDVDFLRELGFKFCEDWDGELTIEGPESLDVSTVIALAKRFREGIATRLFFERLRPRS